MKFILKFLTLCMMIYLLSSSAFIEARKIRKSTKHSAKSSSKVSSQITQAEPSFWEIIKKLLSTTGCKIAFALGFIAPLDSAITDIFQAIYTATGEVGFEQFFTSILTCAKSNSPPTKPLNEQPEVSRNFGEKWDAITDHVRRKALCKENQAYFRSWTNKTMQKKMDPFSAFFVNMGEGIGDAFTAIPNLHLAGNYCWPFNGNVRTHLGKLYGSMDNYLNECLFYKSMGDDCEKTDVTSYTATVGVTDTLGSFSKFFESINKCIGGMSNSSNQSLAKKLKDAIKSKAYNSIF